MRLIIIGVLLAGVVEAAEVKTLADKCEAVGGCVTVKVEAGIASVKQRPTKAKIACHQNNYREDHLEYTQLKSAGYQCKISLPDGEELLLEIYDDHDITKYYKSEQMIREKLPRPKDGDLL